MPSKKRKDQDDNIMERRQVRSAETGEFRDARDWKWTDNINMRSYVRGKYEYIRKILFGSSFKFNSTPE